MSGSRNKAQLDFLVDHAVPWYLNFVAGWTSAWRENPDLILPIRYEDETRITPIAEFDVPKSSPQAVITVPLDRELGREGEVIYYDAPRVARLFVFA